jgi:hypothetical protein
MPHPAESACRSFQKRRPAVYRKLRFTIEDDKHFFALIVKVVSDSALRLNHAAMQEEQIRVEIAWAEQRHVIETSSAVVNARRMVILRRIGMRYSIREGLARLERQQPKEKKPGDEDLSHEIQMLIIISFQR